MKTTITRFLKWLVSGPMLKRYFCAALVLATLIAMFYVVENFRGARAWERTRAHLNENGVTLNIADHLHSPVPDHENFCAIPLLLDLPLVIDGDMEMGAPGAKRRHLSAFTYFKKVEGAPKIPRQKPPIISGERADLSQWRTYIEGTGLFTIPDTGNPAADILEGLNVYAPIFEEMATAVDRPYAVFIPGIAQRLQGHEPLSSLSTPHYSVIQACVATLKMRAIASAQNGDAETALTSLRIIARLVEAIGNEASVLGWLVQTTAVAVMDRGVWEFLNSRTATAQQLHALESTLSNIRIRDSLRSAMQMEVIMATDYLELAKTTSMVELAHLPPEMEPPEELGPALVPNGWWDQNKVVIANRFLHQVLEPLSTGSFEQALLASKEPPPQSSPYSFIAAQHGSISDMLPIRLISQECVNLQMRTSCALERYHIANREYPESLGALIPNFLQTMPLDPVDQQPMRYRKTADSRYILYSIGYDQTDNGGKVHPKGRKIPSFTGAGKNSIIGYDWVWRYSREDD